MGQPAHATRGAGMLGLAHEDRVVEGTVFGPVVGGGDLMLRRPGGVEGRFQTAGQALRDVLNGVERSWALRSRVWLG
jgi:hypothetical protein